MDEVLIHRIDLLIKHADEVINDTHNKTMDEFAESDLLVRATAFSIMQIGEQMTTLKRKIGALYPDLPWDKAIGMRNIIAHVYNNVDAVTVYNTAINDIPQLKDNVLQIRSELVFK